MARTTATEVKQILDNSQLTDTVVDVFITSATEVVTKVFDGDTTIGDTLLEEIERWFTAHMIASTLERTKDTEKLGEASVKYTGQWGKGLDLTPYGQMVKQLDVTGKMANAGKRIAKIRAIESFD